MRSPKVIRARGPNRGKNWLAMVAEKMIPAENGRKAKPLLSAE
jgi:hypothetical protein